MAQLTPGQPFPQIDLARVGGGRITNVDFNASALTVLNVYRGLHCPRCKRQMEDFDAHAAALAEAGIKIFSISTDTQDRAEEVARTWAVGNMPIGYGLTVEGARALGLFISETIREAEPAFFAEAGLFLIQPDGTLWGSSINSFPFVRPTAEMILDAANTKAARSYPPRGNIAA